MTPILIAVLACAAAAAVAGLVVARRAGARLLDSARVEAARLVREAESRAAEAVSGADRAASERAAHAESDLDQQTRRRRQQLQEQEERLREQERNLGRKVQLLGQKQQDLDEREARLKGRETALLETEKEAQVLVQERRLRLERLAGMSTVQARRELRAEIESEARQEAAQWVRRVEEEAREEAAARARRIVAEAIQRLPPASLADNVTTPVRLPNDEMKGRIIGREGRNIRALEMATGVDLIVDDTPGLITLSSFDSFRRAVAHAAIERLIEDGRIHPGRIEEVVARARIDMESALETIGESAAFEIGIAGLPPRLTRLLGRLKYRVVEGYNLLDHSQSVARLAQQLAVALDLPPDVVRRAGLLHEIGQVEETAGPAVHPIALAADVAMRAGEDARVVAAIRALHGGDAEPSLDAALLRLAEKAVIARPGERDGKLEGLIERLRALEAIAASFEGVGRAYAVRSGKELRVIVEAPAVADADVTRLSRQISSRIEKEAQYPGTVKVSVIRETRAVDFAT